jgi:cysteine synthase A
MTVGNLFDIVGKTPLVRIDSLSELTGCNIFAKAEFMNPGGSIKDRAAKSIILQAEKSGELKPHGIIVEGSAGNTGIGLATLAIPRGYKVVITMPNNQAREKIILLQTLGAEVIEVPPCPFADQKHFYHQARQMAQTNNSNGLATCWANQCENTANFDAHFTETGPEIWQQTNGKIDIFLSSVGTGGTFAGVSNYLKSQNSNIKCYIVDPMGSGLYQHFKTKEMKSTGSSVTEGIGIMRITANYAKAKIIDEAYQVQDQEMINMLYHLAKSDGLVVGTSAALNLAAAYKVGLENKNSGKVIVSIIGDHGTRYQSKILNPQWLKEKNLQPQHIMTVSSTPLQMK